MMWIKAGICSGSLLDYLYRVSGAGRGGLMGSLIHFNTEGLGFVMTALFLVIFLEQLLKEKNMIPPSSDFLRPPAACISLDLILLLSPP